jgi:hypothetical protein
VHDQRLAELLSFAGFERSRAAGLDAVFTLSELPAGGASHGRVLLTGCSERPEHHRLLTELSGGVIAAAREVPAADGKISWSSAETIFRELDGFSHDAIVPPNRFARFLLDPSRSHNGRVVARFNGEPWLVQTGPTGQEKYFLGLTHAPDLDETMNSEGQERASVAAVIVFLQFLRAEYPALAWTPGPALANFIIDDPLLKPKYGFLEHHMLAQQVHTSMGAATIAFIPWNARRTDRGTARLYQAGEQLSLCVHGNEHTAGEFADSDPIRLRSKAQESMERMLLHQELSGVPFAPIMVFPQGKFSVESLDALSAAGFIGAINSHYLAADAAHRPRLRDLVTPALSCYGSCPLFLRRYPSDVEALRYDLILGRPAFLVEHHQYFKDGGAEFARTIARVQRIRPAMEWVSTGEAISRTHMTRMDKHGDMRVRFYARQFQFQSRCDRAIECEFEKSEPTGVRVHRVTVDGRSVEFSRVDDQLSFRVVLSPGRKVRVRVETTDAFAASVTRNRRFSRRVQVAVRRYLSEFRDEHVHTNKMLSACYTLASRMR